MEPKHDPTTNPLSHLYKRMDEEVPRNDVEREVLRRLGAGINPLDCMTFAIQNGYTEEEFDAFFERAKQWENENCSKY
ncbi:MAG: hypothetical protein K6G27_15855 [Lachnospiraceae bacterium]|nr:hypothetical protein [Lachnospiraceae bacterium]